MSVSLCLYARVRTRDRSPTIEGRLVCVSASVSVSVSVSVCVCVCVAAAKLRSSAGQLAFGDYD